MQTSRTPQRKAIKFLDAKVFIAAMSVAVTAGLWNLFSVNAIQADQQNTDPDGAPPPPPPSVTEAQELPSLPTLVPLVKIEIPTPSTAMVNAQPQESSTVLRSVAAPTQVVVQKFKPVFDQPEPVAVDNGSRGGKSTKSVTRTRSSR